MNLDIRIETHDTLLVYDLLGKGTANKGDVIPIGNGASIKYRGTLIRLQEGIPEVIGFILIIATDVGVGIVSAWLYDKLKNKKVTLRIDRTIVEIDKGEIERIIHEKITQK